MFRGSGLKGIVAKNPVPMLVGLDSTVKKFPINGSWKNTGITANKDKLIKFDWNINNIVLQPRKYLVVFRLDYRFDMQPMLIYSYNYKTDSYTNDYSNYQGVDLSIAPANIADNLARALLLNQYVSIVNRGILLQSGDVLNIVLLDDLGDIENGVADIGATLLSNSGANSGLYQLNSALPSDMENNVIINMSADDLCRYTPNLANFSQVCLLQDDTKLYAYRPDASIKDIVSGVLALPTGIPRCNRSMPSDYWSLFTQTLDNINAKYTTNSTDTTLDRYLEAADNHLRNYLKKGGDFAALYPDKANLPEDVISRSLDQYPYLYKWLTQDSSCIQDALATKVNYCLQDNGLGLQIAVEGKVIKKDVFSFIPVVDSSINYVYTIKVENSGRLVMSINPNFNSGSINSFLDFEPKLSKNDPSSSGVSYIDGISMTGLQFGRYLMQVSIGSDPASARSAISNLSYEYYIQASGDHDPIDSTSGYSMSLGNSKFDASSNGALWVRVKNNSSNVDLNGEVNIKTTAYTGSQFISNSINNYVVKPVLKRYASAMRAIYDGPTGLINNANIQNIVKTMAGLYIIIYAIYFLLGAVEITASDLLSRIVKMILVVNVLFSENSWQFFNDYLFGMMTKGTAQLIGIFTNSSSSVSNPFSFLDPVFNTYISPWFWLAILAQLAQIWNGLGLLAMLVISSVTLFFATLLEIVMTYILSLIIIYILIGLAPIFIPFLLFSSTKSFFTNWLSVIFKNMLLPAIFIALILIFDQFMSEVLRSTVVGNSWGCLQKLEFNLSIGNWGPFTLIPSNAGFCIPFFIPDIANSNVPVSKVSEVLKSLDAAGLGGINGADPVLRHVNVDTTSGSEVLSNLSPAEAASSTGAGLVLSYLNVAMASFLYYTYTLVAKQLLSFTSDILGKITGIVDSPVKNSVTSISGNSALGRAFKKFSGNDMMNRYVIRRSPVRHGHHDNINEKAWGVTAGSVKKVSSFVANLRRSKKPEEYGSNPGDDGSSDHDKQSQGRSPAQGRSGAISSSEDVEGARPMRRASDDSMLDSDDPANLRSSGYEKFKAEMQVGSMPNGHRRASVSSADDLSSISPTQGRSGAISSPDDLSSISHAQGRSGAISSPDDQGKPRSSGYGSRDVSGYDELKKDILNGTPKRPKRDFSQAQDRRGAFSSLKDDFQIDDLNQELEKSAIIQDSDGIEQRRSSSEQGSEDGQNKRSDKDESPQSPSIKRDNIEGDKND